MATRFDAEIVLQLLEFADYYPTTFKNSELVDNANNYMICNNWSSFQVHLVTNISRETLHDSNDRQGGLWRLHRSITICIHVLLTSSDKFVMSSVFCCKICFGFHQHEQ